VHLWADIPSGNISIVEGARMAAVTGFNIEVIGNGGHGSRPDLCIDPIKPAANILLGISMIPTNRYKTLEPLVINVGKIEAGTMGSIFPERALMEGGIRSFSKEGKEKAQKYIREIAENGAKMYGAEAIATFTEGFPAVVNDKESVDRAKIIVEKTRLFKLDSFEQICASENYSLFLEKYKGFFAFIGIRNEEKGIIYGQHHAKFDIDEDVLRKGSDFFAQYSYTFLNE
jgi:amidohydrolase